MAIVKITAEEAAALIKDNDTVGFGGFTHAGCPKAVPLALAKRAEEEHARGNSFKLNVIAGGSTGDNIDGALTRANAIKLRTPYQSNVYLREAINNNEVEFFDLHLSYMGQQLRNGVYGNIDVAIIEAAEVTESGEIILTSAVGIAPTIASLAKIVIVELNSWHPKELRGIHDLTELKSPPYRDMIAIRSVSDRIGKDHIQIDPSKIVIVETCIENGGEILEPLNDVTEAIGYNLAEFIVQEIKSGRIPASGLPFQLGVGNTANAALLAMGNHKDIPVVNFYTEVIQDAIIDLLENGQANLASAVSLSVSKSCINKIYDNLPFFKEKLILRTPEITNSPEVSRRLGVISMNTAIEIDIYGNVNSSHIMGNKLMNGIGGSGDFTRNAYTSIFLTTATTKADKISKIVPMVTHTDHSEHSVSIIVTEYGVADLRGKSPRQRAVSIIENCAHPKYRPLLREYLKNAGKGHIPFDLYNAFAFHKAFLETGDMLNATL